MKTCIKGVTPEWYVPESERDEDDPVAFQITPLDGFSRTKVSTLSLSGRNVAPGELMIAGADVLIEAFKMGVTGWRNIGDEMPDEGNGGAKVVPLPYSRANMSRLHEEWIMEVGAQVLKVSEMGAAEVKNSSSPLS